MEPGDVLESQSEFRGRRLGRECVTMVFVEGRVRSGFHVGTVTSPSRTLWDVPSEEMLILR